MSSIGQSPFGGPDAFLLDTEGLNSAEVAKVHAVGAFGRDRVAPVINRYWEEARFPDELLPDLARLGIVGGTIHGYGCPGFSPLVAGLVTRELSRADGSLNAFFGVHSALAMGTIALLGSESQRERWLPDMANLTRLGAFALTEAAHGSDSVALETTAKRRGDTWVISGEKRWIGNGHRADLLVLWARDTADDRVKAFVLERDSTGSIPGLHAEEITGKAGKRAIIQAEMSFTDVRVSDENRLPAAQSFRDVSRVLSGTRGGIAWESLGHALAVYDAALEYARVREQFGQPLAAFQLVQAKLAQMLTDITTMQLMCARMARLQDTGSWTVEMASLAKFHAAARAREVCSQGKEILGGNGLLLEHHVVRHLTDMEVVHTYEGTESMQALILGRAITGLAAFT